MIIIIPNNFLDYCLQFSSPGISLFSLRIAMGKIFFNITTASAREKLRKEGAGGCGVRMADRGVGFNPTPNRKKIVVEK